MANPNIMTATSVLGNSTVTSFILRSGLTLLTAPVTGHVYRIIALKFVNVSTSAAENVTLTLGGGEIVRQIAVAQGATLDVITRDVPLYLQEGVALVATTVTADDSLKAFITYEDVS
jgi:hypothetical protein